MKKIMLLGGLRYLIPVIEAAHQQGYYVITADYLPNNIAHKYSDAYCNISIIDKEKVLDAAKSLKIDGIMSFACDPGVVAASYVQNKLGLPSFGPYESIEILQNKDKFRQFLFDNGFNTPLAKGYDNIGDILNDSNSFHWPVIVKPVDSAGSKGVMRVDNYNKLREAAENAMSHSFAGKVIVEEFIEKDGFSSDTDSMAVDGQLVFTNFNSQRFDTSASNPYTPAAYSWPSSYTSEQENYLRSEIQRLITLLDLRTSVFNIETRIGTNGKPYIMELTPRGGGNRLCEMIRYATGTDLITACVRAAVGDPLLAEIKQNPYNGNWAEIILHSSKPGGFLGINIQKYNEYIVEKDIWVSIGDRVNSFDGANDTIGTLVLNFPTNDMMEEALNDIYGWVNIQVEEVRGKR